MMKNFEEARDYVREFLLGKRNVNEFDAILDKRKNWKQEASELKSLMSDLISHIEQDEYRDGIKKIDSAIAKLKVWKDKIEKHLNS
jgi:hypothetical protein